MNSDVYRRKALRPTALLLSVSLVVPPLLAGCGGGGQQSSEAVPPPGMNRNQPVATPRQGLSTKQKVAILAGAAALYYIYKKRQSAPEKAGPQGKYFQSKNGRIYYRNLKTGEFQWVTPPAQPIQVPAAEAEQFRNYAGYNNQKTGQGFGGYGPGQPNYEGGEPAFLVR
jgi:hypothetical protein